MLAVTAVARAEDLTDGILIANVNQNIGVAFLDTNVVVTESANNNGICIGVALFKGNEVGALAQGQGVNAAAKEVIGVLIGCANSQILNHGAGGESQVGLASHDQLSIVGSTVVNAVPNAGVSNGDVGLVQGGIHDEVTACLTNGSAVGVIQSVGTADNDGAAALSHQLFPSLIQSCILKLVGIRYRSIVVAGGGLQGAVSAAAIALRVVADENNVVVGAVSHDGNCTQGCNHRQRQKGNY